MTKTIIHVNKGSRKRQNLIFKLYFFFCAVLVSSPAGNSGFFSEMPG